MFSNIFQSQEAGDRILHFLSVFILRKLPFGKETKF